MTANLVESSRQLQDADRVHRRDVGHALLHQAKHALESVLKVALRTALTQSLEHTLTRMTEGVLRDGIGRVLDVAPQDVVSDEVERELEELVHTVVQEILSGIGTGATASEPESDGQNAGEDSPGSDAESSRTDAGAILATIPERIASVLARHRQDFTGLAVRVLTRVTADAAANKLEEGVQAIEPGDNHGGDKHEKPDTESANEHSGRVRHSTKGQPRTRNHGENGVLDQLTSLGESLKEQLSSESEGLQKRLQEGAKSAVKQGTQNQKLGHAPAGRHPSAGNAARRGPSQKPPGIRRRSK